MLMHMLMKCVDAYAHEIPMELVKKGKQSKSREQNCGESFSITQDTQRAPCDNHMAADHMIP
jgi:hypothetical protein